MLTMTVNVNKSHRRLLTLTMVAPKLASLRKGAKHYHLGLYTEGSDQKVRVRVGLDTINICITYK